MLEVVEKSARGNTPYVVDHSIVSYDWDGYLTNFYKPLQGILALHQITVSQAGVFTRKNLSDESTSVKLMKANKPLDGDLPAVLPQKGLDAKRQWYLYEAIRPFCMFGTDVKTLPLWLKKSHRILQKWMKKNDPTIQQSKKASTQEEE